MSEESKPTNKKSRKPIKYFYIKVFIPISLGFIFILVSFISYAYLYPKHIYYMQHYDKLTSLNNKEYQILTSEKLNRIQILNAKIDNIDDLLVQDELKNKDQLLELRAILINERNEIWAWK